jgi:hypothetical protein
MNISKVIKCERISINNFIQLPGLFVGIVRKKPDMKFVSRMADLFTGKAFQPGDGAPRNFGG